ncbi:Protein yippee-like CG15309 [Ceratocystis fimbriata CBS 114723]|uniref:Protein yippee-like n=1 Tax=Ceratocystis fimbriata CBS 114723 TaxID=1035309 RepID=A0A2C5WWU2_9PEZI|nr:Protein yippee-like CG15309 [Ceratocystis fimbriata CBS 114723]
MGLKHNVYLSDNTKIYHCKKCRTHLSAQENIMSKSFRGTHGTAYLFDTVVNIECGDPNDREMTTGRHIVRDIMCRQCKVVVGWTYDKAYEPREQYKEGKFILELDLLICE